MLFWYVQRHLKSDDDANCNQNCTKKVLILLMSPFEIFLPFKYSGKHNYVDYIPFVNKIALLKFEVEILYREAVHTLLVERSYNF